MALSGADKFRRLTTDSLVGSWDAGCIFFPEKFDYYIRVKLFLENIFEMTIELEPDSKIMF